MIGLGTWQFGKHFWGDVKDPESLNVIRYAIEKNIPLIDTAPVYGDGHSETIVGQAIEDNTGDIKIATKCGLIHTKKGFFHNLEKKSLEKELIDSLRRLQKEQIDLYQIHWPDPNYSTDKAIETLLSFKERKIIKKIGVCNLSLKELQNLELLSHIDTVQLQFSLISTEETYNILSFCKEKNIQTITYGTFQGGLLLDKFKTTEDIPNKSAKNFFYQGKNNHNWGKLQNTISTQKESASKSQLSLPQQILQETQSLSKSSFTLIGCRTLKQAKELF